MPSSSPWRATIDPDTIDPDVDDSEEEEEGEALTDRHGHPVDRVTDTFTGHEPPIVQGDNNNDRHRATSSSANSSESPDKVRVCNCCDLLIISHLFQIPDITIDMAHTP